MTIEYNTLEGSISTQNGVIANNLILDPSVAIDDANGWNNLITNNVCIGTIDTETDLIASGNTSNITGAVRNELIVDSGTTDGVYEVLPTGDAATASVTAAEVGMFGGNFPYVLSGVPSLPRITAATIPGASDPSNGRLNIQISARSGN